jgi:hypothetical protein
MELSFSLRSPDPAEQGAPARSALRDALARASDASRDPLGTLPVEPWRFYPLNAEAVSAVAWLYARLLEEEVGAEGARAAYDQWRSIPGWVVVTCRRLDDAEAMERAREDTLTAVQRYSLSLWSDHVPTNWLTDVITESPELYRLLDIDPEAEVALGILWYGHAERDG